MVDVQHIDGAARPTDLLLSGVARDANGNVLALQQRSGPRPLQWLS
jgi:hypothetical protein